MKPRRVVVAGTGTEVGKTRFVVEVQRRLREAGRRTLALKPIETGYAPGASVNSDASRIALHNSAAPPPLYAFPEPLSPHIAAELADASIDPLTIVPWVEAFELVHFAPLHRAESGSVSPEPPPLSFVELAGGLFTPLTLTQVNLDLVRLLEPCRFLLVASDRLGVLHDAMVCSRAAEVFHRAPDLVVFSQHAPDYSSAGNRAQFERLLPNIQTCTLGPNLELDLPLSWFDA